MKSLGHYITIELFVSKYLKPFNYVKTNKLDKISSINYGFTNHMYKEDLAFNNLQWLICHKTQPNQIIYIYIYIYIYHHVVPLARISLTFSCHFSLSVITPGRFSGLHLVSSHSCCMCVRGGRPAFARPYVGVHRSASLMSSSLLQQCPACLVRITWIVFVMGGRWPYSWCLVGCCRQDLFNIARYILLQLLLQPFS